MDKAKLVAKLNEAIAHELGAALQYNQYSLVLRGPERRIWTDWFEDKAKESFSHARKFGVRVNALGGTPACEPVPVKQTKDLSEMLENSLVAEETAVRLYTEALEFCGDHPGYRNLLEDQVQDEMEDAEELAKVLDRIADLGTARKGKGKQKTG